MNAQLIIIGGGGFAQEVAWAARRMAQFEILGCCDDNRAKHGTTVAGLRVLGTIETVAGAALLQAGGGDAGSVTSPCTMEHGRDTQSTIFFICATGNNRLRAKFAQRATAVGWTAVNVIDPSVLIAEDVRLGQGIYVGAGSILSCNAEIRDHVLINQHCTIGHDTLLEKFSQVAPGGRLSGCVILREGASVASNAIVRQSRQIGAWAMVGAGSFAVTDIPAGTTVIGNPATAVFSAKDDNEQ